MPTGLLQDWITVQQNGGSSLAQSASGWLDIGAFEDLILVVNVTSIPAGAATLYYETAPTKEDAAFLPLLTGFNMARGVRTDSVQFAYALTPPAQYLRWRVAFNADAQSVTFQVTVTGYSLTDVGASPGPARGAASGGACGCAGGGR